MAIARQELLPPPLTYEEYLAEDETLERYDIVDGVREVTNPTRRHQRLLLRLARMFQDFEAASGAGQTLIAPCDILIRPSPLRTRQPDVLFISHERLAQAAPEDDPAPLEVAPELVVEILSPSNTRQDRAAKIEDYRQVGVRECWLVSPEAATVEVLQLSAEGAATHALFGLRDTARSAVFPGLQGPVEELFQS